MFLEWSPQSVSGDWSLQSVMGFHYNVFQEVQAVCFLVMTVKAFGVSETVPRRVSRASLIHFSEVFVTGFQCNIQQDSE